MLKITAANLLVIATKKMSELAEELREAIIYEACTYHVVLVGDFKQKFYMLYLKGGSPEPVCHGRAADIRKYLDRRKVEPVMVYDYKLVELVAETVETNIL